MIEHQFKAERHPTAGWIATCACGWRLEAVGYAWPHTARIGWENEHVRER